MKKRIVFILFSITIYFVWSAEPTATDSEPVSIVAYHIPTLLERQSSDAPYSKLLALITARIEQTSDIQIQHALRAAEQFNRGKSDCLFPGSLSTYSQDTDLIESHPFLTAKAYLFAPTKLNVSNLLALDSPPLKIGFRRGNTFGKTIDKLSHHNLIPLQSGSEINEMLSRDRIDAFLDYLPDAYAVINKNPNQPLKYDDSSLFYTQNDSLLCHNTLKLRKFVDSFNQQIELLKASGEFQQVLKIEGL